MDIVYSSNDNYVQHMAVSMVSLMENNLNLEIVFYIFDDQISKENKGTLWALCNRYGARLTFIDFQKIARSLERHISCPISISTYARLFIPEFLPANCDRVLYLDCDTVINSDISELVSLDMARASVAGVLDTLPSAAKKNIGLHENAPYINGGVLLIDLKKWRNENRQHDFLKFLEARNWNVFFQDQGVVNAVLKNELMVLAPKYNAMTPVFTTQYSRLISLYDLKGYYSEIEVLEAKTHPAILHFTTEYVGRVWEKGCLHPRQDLYLKYLSLTPWRGLIRPKSYLPVKLRLLYWMERKLPVWILRLIGC